MWTSPHPNREGGELRISFSQRSHPAHPHPPRWHPKVEPRGSRRLWYVPVSGISVVERLVACSVFPSPCTAIQCHQLQLQVGVNSIVPRPHKLRYETHYIFLSRHQSRWSLRDSRAVSSQIPRSCRSYRSDRSSSEVAHGCRRRLHGFRHSPNQDLPIPAAWQILGDPGRLARP